MRIIFSSLVLCKILEGRINDQSEDSKMNFEYIDGFIYINKRKYHRVELIGDGFRDYFSYSICGVKYLIKVLSLIPEQPVTLLFNDNLLVLSGITFK